MIKTDLKQALQHKIDTKTKPLGALGKLEDLAFKIGCIQNTETPKISKPVIVVFAADHGIAAKGEVNPFPQEVTAQMVYNFVNGGAAINVFSKTNDIELKVVDAGVNHTFDAELNIIDAKIDFGTKNYQLEPAMTQAQCTEAFTKAGAIVEELQKKGCNTIGFGEMGIGNTSSAALLMSYFTITPIEDCVGSGTGLDPEGISKKAKILSEVYNKYAPKSAQEALATFGGFEVAMLCGAILKASELNMVIVIDGFIVTAALLAATEIKSEVIENCVFAHSSDEQGHQRMLAFLEAEPLLSLGLRLGEGTGAALAIPLLRASVDFLSDMASFESAGVSNES
ncbi:nicotinate-nucleotide--dimethylbenzimidazole phosphoribosyltransferase [Tamlana sp. 2_MG-2023]|uniref:nicotinate-nucleotide--dimethylbenzimidazole phosphoribosyltransferase n=1 Tax=unclassified Tamlana TaxID=2614803 RepID=UPI0026E15070|nr:MULTISPECIES: nicotinate-nucleotide--dimethylbenzimidazole phosphoribosyltransferase [unclassified Tamlana]MDO6760048.1 nicotinate-nucleotide--dimethylbenzimidazole phosphoribosyltransferase [Tamlana sp. 2_MG-2023]MDO6790254.1 nicotinate-nucleotide--dimethylbenzimidazole phosphoribosyltransferase [Tamlana sp. 1_MG-2023]